MTKSGFKSLGFNMRSGSFLRQAAYYFLIAVLVLILGGLGIPTLNLPGGLRVFTVQSNSMAPRMSVGNLIVVKPSVVYQKGEIITFYPQTDKTNPKKTITHRVDQVIPRNDGVFYLTRGDANNSTDENLIPSSLILGKVVLSIPQLGRTVDFIRVRKGLKTIVVGLGLGIVLLEILKIKKELASQNRPERETKEETASSPEAQSPKKRPFLADE